MKKKINCADDVPPLKEQINNFLNKYPKIKDIIDNTTEDIAKEISNLVMETTKNYKNFYRFDREEDNFDCNIALGASPRSNAETVKKGFC